LDILSGFSELPICHAYSVNGKKITEMPASLSQFREAKPVYEALAGWGNLTPDMIERGFSALPETLQQYVKYIEDQVDCPVSIISMGPQRHETIIR
jgi:adenylosuccinate synthase